MTSQAVLDHLVAVEWVGATGASIVTDMNGACKI